MVKILNAEQTKQIRSLKKDYFHSDAESDAQNNYTEDDIEIDEDYETDGD